ncbi:unnamed protein product [Agarophyton chilense]
MLANDLPLSTADNPLFQQLLLTAVAPTAPAAQDADHAHSRITHHQLQHHLSSLSSAQVMHPFADSPPSPHASANLIIYFTDASRQASACCRKAHAQNNNHVVISHDSAAYVASVFRFVSQSHLSYLFSRNCRLGFSSNVTDIVHHAQQQSDFKFAQVLISRPLVAVDKPRALPNSEQGPVWVADVGREVDILCHELLAQVPLFIRVHRRNKMLASYFREDSSNAVADHIFRRDDYAKEKLHPYLQFIVKPPPAIQSFHVFELASHTHQIVCKAQHVHEDAKRVVDTRSFIASLTEDNCGCVPLSQEIIRLLLSTPYRTELKSFLSIMKPLTALISLYNITGNVPPLSYSSPLFDVNDLFRCPLEFRSRSLAHVLPDCVRTMREIYSEKLPEHEEDMHILREHAMCRLLGKGVDGCPPVADDISCIAALLNPSGDLSNTKGITVDEVLRRAVQYIQTHHSEKGEVGVKTVLDQLEQFHNRKGQFADDNMFGEASEGVDPLEWWDKFGHVAPELQPIALGVLSVPTTAFAAVQHMTNLNACSEDLQRSVADEEMEKRRFITWNLRLHMGRVKAAEREAVAEGDQTRTEPMLL